MEHVIYMTRLCQGLEVSFDIYNTESVLSEGIFSTGRFEGISINESIQHIICNIAGYRLLPCYVNLLLLLSYYAMLQSINLREATENDEISYFIAGHNFIGLFWKS